MSGVLSGANPENDDVTPERLAEPIKGQYFNFLIGKLRTTDPERAAKLESETVRVVSKFAHPKAVSKISSAQLVLGEVQSGKTSNMVSTIALALDNQIPLIVVMTGTQTMLSSQTVRDIRRQLRFDETETTGPFLNFIEEAGKVSSVLHPEVQDVAALNMASMWHRTAGTDGKALCIFLLKHADTMRNFQQAMAAQKDAVRNLPVLIIDDEADAAGPDTSKPNSVLGLSKTNQAISAIRDLFPRHNYLLYTATPQALLLSHLGNALSPDSVTVLDAGNGYVGVADLFPPAGSTEPAFAKELSITDVNAFVTPSTYPDSLIHALAAMLVRGAVARRSPFDLNFVTMMIHTSQRKNPMRVTADWVSSQLEEWHELFTEAAERKVGSGQDPQFSDHWRRYFEPAISELQSDLGIEVTAVDLEPRSLISGIRTLLDAKTVKVVNSDTDNIEDNHWGTSILWIVIGGNNLGRGFRVENLIVTYMPRQPLRGDSSLDTVQQRGRFFGYRRKYRKLLKAWLAPNIVSTFKDYREHEGDLRGLLKEIEIEDLPLKGWKRILRSPGNRNFTRKNVIKLFLSTLSYPAGKTAFTHDRLYFPGLAPKTRALLDQLIADVDSIEPGLTIGSGGQLSRAKTGELNFDKFEGFLLALYEVLEGEESFKLGDLIDHLGQFHAEDEDGLLPPACQVIFHEWTLDPNRPEVERRGPKDGKYLGEQTRISSLSANNAPGQAVRLNNELEMKKFILHVHLFDVYVEPVMSANPGDLFASEQPAFRLQVPVLPFASSAVQK